ncbi:MAG TPA: F0F1 ATP synthase subunit epsilon [Alphaproteobacteria bacterium]|nr:F0F1 ATP synthase subunit epsilon [Alphaproteobacteria bacterium]
MKLIVTTPLSVVVDVDGVRHVRAEDETGAFGVLQGHADFLTVLAISVITWRDESGREHHVAVRGGVLMVRDGDTVEIATRAAVAGDDLDALQKEVSKWFRDEAEAEEESRVSAGRLHLAAIRQIQKYLDAGHRPVPRGMPANLESGLSKNVPEFGGD